MHDQNTQHERSSKCRRHQQRHRQSSDHVVSSRQAVAEQTTEPTGPLPRLLRRWSVVGVCGLLVLAVAVVFEQVVHHEFVNYDDDQYVYGNPKVTAGLSFDGIVWAFTHSHAGNWHPLTWISHMADCRFYGLQPGGHHLSSVALHAASAVILFLVLLWMTGDRWSSAFVAAVFAIHPLRAESVAWVAERKDVLSGLFFMLTLAFHTWYARQPFSLVRYLAVVGSLVLGLMAKPMLVTVPFVLLLLDYWPLGRFGAKEGTHLASIASSAKPSWSPPSRVIFEKIPLLLLSLASCIATLASQGSYIKPLETVSLLSRIANALVSYASYLWMLFWPTNLAAFYPLPVGLPPLWKVLAAALLLLGISAGTLVVRRTHPCLLVGWLWYLGMLVPVIGLITVGDQAMADRYTYLPLIGPCIAIVWAVAAIFKTWRYRHWALCGTATLVVACLMHSAWIQVSYWRNSESLWTHVLACTSDNCVAHSNLGIVLAARGRTREAIAHYQQALEAKPDDPIACNNMGAALVDIGRIDEGTEYYQRALRSNPRFAQAYYNMGNARVQQKRLEEAVGYFRKAVQLAPEVARFQNNLGAALADRGRVDEAIDHYRKAAIIRPDYGDPHYNLGNAMVRRGQLDRAVSQWREAVRLNPRDAKSHLALAKSYSRQRKLADAIHHFRIVLKINPRNAEARQGLNSILNNGRGTVEPAAVGRDSTGIRNVLPSFPRDNGRGGYSIVQHSNSVRSQDVIDVHPVHGLKANDSADNTH